MSSDEAAAGGSRADTAADRSNVVPLGSRRGQRPDPAAAVRAGADRAGGERERRRRRVTPLLEEAQASRERHVRDENASDGDEGGAVQPANAAAASRNAESQQQSQARHPSAGGRRGLPPSSTRQRVDDETVDRASRLADATAEATHLGQTLAADLPPTPDPSALEDVVMQVVAFLRRRIGGEYTVDDFGFDRELTETVVMALLRPLYRRWFRVEVRGVENIPDSGGALIVANHSGTIAVDALMTHVALFDEHPAHRHLRLLAADLVFETPVMADLARKVGSTLATNADAERLLNEGELVGVFPEGFKGIGKPFSERYKLQRFGRGGFVSAALRTSTPIFPCSIVGAEEIYPIIGRSATLARLLNVPYVPITPTFPLLGLAGLVPLPSKWLIEFGEPIPTDELGLAGADDPMLVFDLTDRVRETIQQTLYSLLMQRRSVFF